MPSNWKWKTALVIASIVIGIYLLVPTFGRFNETWQKVDAGEISSPWYLSLFPRKVINLGLDLQGGIYVEMAVNVDDAISHHIDILASDVERLLKEENIPISEIKRTEKQQLVVKLGNPNDGAKANQLIENQVGDSYRGRAFGKISSETRDNLLWLTYAMPDSFRDPLATSIVKQALETVRNRIDRYGVAETEILLQGSDRIAIELPGLKDPEQAMAIIQQSGQLAFHLVDESKSSAELATLIAEVRKDGNIPEGFSQSVIEKINVALKEKLPENRLVSFEIERDPITKKAITSTPYLINQKAELTGDMLENASVQIQNNEPYVDLTFGKRGTDLFGELTKANVGKRLAILLDGYVNSAPNIREPILQGRARITLGFGDYANMLKEAEILSLVLQEGALPAKLTEATKTVVGPTLGQDSIKKGLNACAVGALIVIIFMMIYYKMSGLYANIALIVNITLLMAILSLFEATLTLPGIAGIALTLGMAVDANVIISERIREEIRSGKGAKAAIQSGYDNASRAVLDSNITTLIAGIVLYQFGTGPIRGFAVTLSVGILTTLFSAIVVTRLIYDYMIIKRKITKVSI